MHSWVSVEGAYSDGRSITIAACPSFIVNI